MFQVGILIHKAKSGRLIFKLSKEVRSGTYIVDGKGKRIGKVIELLGPVRSPYASVAPSSSRPKAGDPAFVESFS